MGADKVFKVEAAISDTEKSGGSEHSIEKDRTIHPGDHRTKMKSVDAKRLESGLNDVRHQIGHDDKDQEDGLGVIDDPWQVKFEDGELINPKVSSRIPHTHLVTSIQHPTCPIV